MHKHAVHVLALCIALATPSSFAAENATDTPAQPATVTRHLLNGLFSLDVPETWHIEIDEQGRGVVLSEFPGSPCTIAIAAPNPAVDPDGLASYAEAVAKAAFGAFANGEIVGTNDTPFKGKPARGAVFKAEAPDGPVVGLVGAMHFDGFTVSMLVCGPQEDFGDFIHPAGRALETFELNRELAEQKRSELAGIGKAIIDDLAKP